MTPFSYVCWHYFFVCVWAWLLHTSVVTYTCTWRDSRVCCTKKLPVATTPNRCVMTPLCVCHDSFVCACVLTYLLDTSVMTHSYAWHDSRVCCTKTWPLHTIAHRCDMTHIYMCHDAFMRVIWLTCMLDKDVSYHYYSKQVRYDFFLCARVLTWLLYTSSMTHSCARHVSCACCTNLLQSGKDP